MPYSATMASTTRWEAGVSRREVGRRGDRASELPCSCFGAQRLGLDAAERDDEVDEGHEQDESPTVMNSRDAEPLSSLSVQPRIARGGCSRNSHAGHGRSPPSRRAPSSPTCGSVATNADLNLGSARRVGVRRAHTARRMPHSQPPSRSFGPVRAAPASASVSASAPK